MTARDLLPCPDWTRLLQCLFLVWAAAWPPHPGRLHHSIVSGNEQVKAWSLCLRIQPGDKDRNSFQFLWGEPSYTVVACQAGWCHPSIHFSHLNNISDIIIGLIPRSGLVATAGRVSQDRLDRSLTSSHYIATRHSWQPLGLFWTKGQTFLIHTNPDPLVIANCREFVTMWSHWPSGE